MLLYDACAYSIGASFILPLSLRLVSILTTVALCVHVQCKKQWEYEDECAICLTKLQPAVISLKKCKHKFHVDCVQTLDKCPLCREYVT